MTAREESKLSKNEQTTFITELPIEPVKPSEHPQSEDEFLAIEQLQRLVSLIDQSDVSELEIKHGKKVRVRLRKTGFGEQVEYQATQVEELSPSAQGSDRAEQAHTTIMAPLVGVFHLRSQSKEGRPLQVGDTVQEGQPLGAIASLNVHSEVEAPVTGSIVDIFVGDCQPVEYGQPLVVIDSGRSTSAPARTSIQ